MTKYFVVTPIIEANVSDFLGLKDYSIRKIFSSNLR